MEGGSGWGRDELVGKRQNETMGSGAGQMGFNPDSTALAVGPYTSYLAALLVSFPTYKWG